ncbi:MAG: hypothetical protein ACRDX9_14245 [Acidimicrobiia bacterium]
MKRHVAPTARMIVWLALCLGIVNQAAWDYSPWAAPQEEWFHHALQWGGGS